MTSEPLVDRGYVTGGDCASSVGNQTLSSLDGDANSVISSGKRRLCLSPSTRLKLAAACDVHRQSTSDEDSGCALEEYVWVPSGLRPNLVHQYFACLPDAKVPYVNSVGEKWRIKQLLYQLPPHDTEPRYCRHLTSSEQKDLKLFVQQRKRDSLGRGNVKVIPYSLENAPCAQCNQPVYAGDLGVFASRISDQSVWHPSCVVCHTCHELLVDLIYFYKDGRLYCGRHHAELYKPRCAGCDEIIFSNECTEAEGRSWHLHHFICYQCDACLGGDRYVMRDGRSYCLRCFEIIFADPCATCQSLIAVDDPRMSHDGRQWHANSQCFVCVVCKQSLIGKPFVPKYDNVFCSAECLGKCAPRTMAVAQSNRTAAAVAEKRGPLDGRTFAHFNFNQFNLDELLRQSEDDDDDDYQLDTAAKLFHLPLDLSSLNRDFDEQQIANKVKQRKCGGTTGSEMMARSAITEISASDVQSVHSCRSLPDLSSSNVSVSSKNSRQRYRRRNRATFYDDLHRAQTICGKSASVRSRSTEGSYKKACANSVITTLTSKKETTFGVVPSSFPKTKTSRTVRFGVPEKIDDDDDDRGESILTEALRGDNCSTCSSSSSNDDDYGDYGYYTKPYQVNNSRLNKEYGKESRNDGKPVSDIFRTKSNSKRGRSKSGNNCIVS